MNQEITQLNSLTSSVKIAENDHSKIKEKYELIIKDEKILDTQYKELEADFNKEKERFAEFKKKIEEEMEKHNNEINEIENKLKDRTADKDLYFELKTLESEIQNLQNDNNFLEKEISDVGNGLNTPGYRIHLHKNCKLNKYHVILVTEDEKTKLLEQLSKNLFVQKHQGFLTLGSIKSIFDATILYHSKDFIIKTYRDRIGNPVDIFKFKKEER
jgi:chromosome segregation ATPase